MDRSSINRLPPQFSASPPADGTIAPPNSPATSPGSSHRVPTSSPNNRQQPGTMSNAGISHSSPERQASFMSTVPDEVPLRFRSELSARLRILSANEAVTDIGSSSSQSQAVPVGSPREGGSSSANGVHQDLFFTQSFAAQSSEQPATTNPPAASQPQHSPPRRTRTRAVNIPVTQVAQAWDDPSWHDLAGQTQAGHNQDVPEATDNWWPDTPPRNE